MFSYLNLGSNAQLAKQMPKKMFHDKLVRCKIKCVYIIGYIKLFYKGDKLALRIEIGVILGILLRIVHLKE